MSTEFAPGDLVIVTRGEKLLFRDKEVRYADEGETFTVLAHRAAEKKLFVQAKDEKGQVVALSVAPDAVELRPALDGRACMIQGRRLEGAVIEKIDGSVVLVRHSGGATQFHSGVIPPVLLRDYEARQRSASGARRSSGRRARFAMTMGDCLNAIPGLELRRASMAGNLYEQQRDDGVLIKVHTRHGKVASVLVEWKGDTNSILLDALLIVFSEGESWRRVPPSIGLIRREWTRSDGGASAQLLDNALMIQPVTDEQAPE